MAAALAALFAEVGLRLLEPWPIQVVFDRVIRLRTEGGRAGWAGLETMDSGVVLVTCALMVVAITGLRAVAGYWNTVGFAVIGNRVMTQVRAELFRHLHYLSLSFHHRARSGDLVVRVISDVGLLQDIVVTALLPMMAKTLILAGMVGLMFWMHWQLALLAVALLPLFWLRTVRLSRRIHETASKQRRREGAMAATASESIGAMRVVQALSLEGMFASAFSSANDRSLKEDVKGKRLAASLERSVDVLIALATALVLWRGTQLVLRGQLTPGELLVFLAYLKSAYRPVQDFAKYTGRLGKAAAAGERVLEILEKAPAVRDLPGARPAPTLRGQVEFEGVDFGYDEDHLLLQGIHLRVEPGQLVALVGPSGSGKSTLLSLLPRLYDPTRGRIRVDGQDIREFTVESLRRQVSFVLQDNVLFATSVRDNIACGLAQVTEDQVREAARLANAEHFILRLKHGYDTVLGERGITLSQGQRQRLAIARAAIRQSPILILDEPTTGLDGDSERAVMDALQRVRSGCTVILITHHLRQAASADRIVYLDHGRIVETGTHAELLAAGGRYATLWSRQAMETEAGNVVGI